MTRIRSKFRTLSVPSRVIAGGSASGGTTCNRPQPSIDELWEQYKGTQVDTEVSVRREITMVDELTPDYHARKRAGEILPTNPMKYTEVDIPEETIYSGIRYLRGVSQPCSSPPSSDPERQSWRFNTGRRTAEIRRAPALMPASSYRSALNHCRVDAKAKLHSQGMDWLTSAVEAHKTIAMLTGVKRKFQDSFLKTSKYVIRDIKQRKLRVRTIQDVWDLFQGYWLEGRFGWRILYYDLLSLDNYLRSKNDAPSLIVGRSSTEVSDVITRSSPYNSTVHRKVKITVGYPGLLNPSILGYANPLNTAWDIIPFSLVVDWFLDVQSFILAHTGAPSNVQSLPHASFEVIESESIEVASPSLEGIEDLIRDSGPPPVITLRNYSKSRTVASDPKVWFPPLAGGPKGYQRLDLVALIRPMLGYLL